MMKPYSAIQPARAEIDARHGATVLDFGTNWCGYCQRAAPLIAQALASRRAGGGPCKSERWPGSAVGPLIGYQAVADADLSKRRQRACAGGAPRRCCIDQRSAQHA